MVPIRRAGEQTVILTSRKKKSSMKTGEKKKKMTSNEAEGKVTLATGGKRRHLFTYPDKEKGLLSREMARGNEITGSRRITSNFILVFRKGRKQSTSVRWEKEDGCPRGHAERDARTLSLFKRMEAPAFEKKKRRRAGKSLSEKRSA